MAQHPHRKDIAWMQKLLFCLKNDTARDSITAPAKRSGNVFLLLMTRGGALMFLFPAHSTARYIPSCAYITALAPTVGTG